MNKHRPLQFVIGLALGAASLFSGGPVALGATAAGPVPDCAYDDVITPYRAYTDWPSTLLDTTFMVGPHYVPPRLVSVSEAGISGNGRVRALVVKDLFLMKWAAFKAGNPLEVVSAYRSFEDQQQTFRSWVKTDGFDKALTTSARAGHSEHQLGTTLDFKAKGGRAPWLVQDWADTRAGAWMKANGNEKGAGLMCNLSASQTALSKDDLKKRYKNKKNYVSLVEKRVSELEKAGWSLPMYHDLIVGDAAKVDF